MEDAVACNCAGHLFRKRTSFGWLPLEPTHRAAEVDGEGELKWCHILLETYNDLLSFRLRVSPEVRNL
ncbi:MAG: hypothetical protein AAF236_02020, partial [Verrucomicrobiota bacterium]